MCVTFSVSVLTFCSNAVNNAILATRALTVCSTLVIPELTVPTASLKVLTWLSKSANPRASGGKKSRSSLNCASCEGVGGVQGALTLFCGGVARAFHDDRVVELKGQLVVEEVKDRKEK